MRACTRGRAGPVRVNSTTRHRGGSIGMAERRKPAARPLWQPRVPRGTAFDRVNKSGSLRQSPRTAAAPGARAGRSDQSGVRRQPRTQVKSRPPGRTVHHRRRPAPEQVQMRKPVRPPDTPKCRPGLAQTQPRSPGRPEDRAARQCNTGSPAGQPGSITPRAAIALFTRPAPRAAPGDNTANNPVPDRPRRVPGGRRPAPRRRQPKVPARWAGRCRALVARQGSSGQQAKVRGAGPRIMARRIAGCWQGSPGQLQNRPRKSQGGNHRGRRTRTAPASRSAATIGQGKAHSGRVRSGRKKTPKPRVYHARIGSGPFVNIAPSKPRPCCPTGAGVFGGSGSADSSAPFLEIVPNDLTTGQPLASLAETRSLFAARV